MQEVDACPLEPVDIEFAAAALQVVKAMDGHARERLAEKNRQVASDEPSAAGNQYPGERHPAGHAKPPFGIAAPVAPPLANRPKDGLEVMAIIPVGIMAAELPHIADLPDVVADRVVST